MLRQTHPLKLSIECCLYNCVGFDCFGYFLRQFFTVYKINNIYFPVIYGIGKQEYLKSRRVGIFIHSALDKVYVRKCFNVYA